MSANVLLEILKIYLLVLNEQMFEYLVICLTHMTTFQYGFLHYGCFFRCHRKFYLLDHHGKIDIAIFKLDKQTDQKCRLIDLPADNLNIEDIISFCIYSSN